MARELMAVSTRILEELASCKEALSACKQRLALLQCKKPALQLAKFTSKSYKMQLVFDNTAQKTMGEAAVAEDKDARKSLEEGAALV